MCPGSSAPALPFFSMLMAGHASVLPECAQQPCSILTLVIPAAGMSCHVKHLMLLEAQQERSQSGRSTLGAEGRPWFIGCSLQIPNNSETYASGGMVIHKGASAGRRTSSES